MVPASAKLRIAGARKAVMKLRPAGMMVCSRRAAVIMPRSPISTTRSIPKRCLSLLIWLASAAVAQLRQRTGATLEIGGGHVIENQHPVAQVTPRQRLLDAPLFSSQPVERFIELLLVDGAKLKHLAQRAGRRLVIEPPRRRQLRGGINEPRHDHGDAQCHLAARLPAAPRQDA